jgi:hypothetical protein
MVVGISEILDFVYLSSGIWGREFQKLDLFLSSG